MTPHRLRIALSLLAALALAGCGGGGSGLKLAQVEGTVTLDGQPLPDAEVVFQPSKGRPSTGVTDAQGRYVLSYTRDEKGAAPGKHKVTISTLLEADPDSSNPALKSGRPERVPPKYNKQSTLEIELASGEKKTEDFKLESPAKR